MTAKLPEERLTTHAPSASRKVAINHMDNAPPCIAVPDYTWEDNITEAEALRLRQLLEMRRLARTANPLDENDEDARAERYRQTFKFMSRMALVLDSDYDLVQARLPKLWELPETPPHDIEKDLRVLWPNYSWADAADKSNIPTAEHGTSDDLGVTGVALDDQEMIDLPEEMNLSEGLNMSEDLNLFSVYPTEKDLSEDLSLTEDMDLTKDVSMSEDVKISEMAKFLEDVKSFDDSFIDPYMEKELPGSHTTSSDTSSEIEAQKAEAKSDDSRKRKRSDSVSATYYTTSS